MSEKNCTKLKLFGTKKGDGIDVKFLLLLKDFFVTIFILNFCDDFFYKPRSFLFKYLSFIHLDFLNSPTFCKHTVL